MVKQSLNAPEDQKPNNDNYKRAK